MPKAVSPWMFEAVLACRRSVWFLIDRHQGTCLCIEDQGAYGRDIYQGLQIVFGLLLLLVDAGVADGHCRWAANKTSVSSSSGVNSRPPFFSAR